MAPGCVASRHAELRSAILSDFASPRGALNEGRCLSAMLWTTAATLTLLGAAPTLPPKLPPKDGSDVEKMMNFNGGDNLLEVLQREVNTIFFLKKIQYFW